MRKGKDKIFFPLTRKRLILIKIRNTKIKNTYKKIFQSIPSIKKRYYLNLDKRYLNSHSLNKL
ncbi:MAG: hypothetical protein QT08_C0018G0021 [archaeon GW2011_AR17]|nr:MAG: hypothetical protein QT08_C0018G0021 [archaeon GW2011_AR17]